MGDFPAKILFDELDLKSFCSIKILNEAKNIFRSGAIKDFVFKKGALKARYYENKNPLYVISFTKTGSEISYYCNCSEKEKFCKHIAALCLYYLESVSAKKTKVTRELDIRDVDSLPIDDHDIGEYFINTKDLKKNSGLILRVESKHQKFSLYFFDLKSGRVLGDSFFLIHPINIVFDCFNEKVRQILNKYFVLYGHDFFLKNTFYSIEKAGKHISDLVLSTKMYSSDFVLYKKQIDKLSFVLCFNLKKSKVYMNADWLIEKTNRFIDFRAGVLLPGKEALFITKDSFLSLKNSDLYFQARPFIKHPRMVIELEKFIQFLKDKMEALTAKGLIINLSDDLKGISIEKKAPIPYLQVKYFREILAVRLFFYYGNQGVIYSSKIKFIYDPDKKVFYKRDFEKEREIRDFFSAEFHLYKRKQMFLFEGQNKYELLDYLDSQENVFKLLNKNFCNYISIDKEEILPEISFKKAKKPDDLRFEISFKYKEKVLKDNNFLEIIQKGGRYYKAADGKINRIKGYSFLEKLLIDAKQLKRGFAGKLNIGQVLFLYQNLGKHLVSLNQIQNIIDVLLNPSPDPAVSKEFDRVLHKYQKKGVSWLLMLREHGWGGVLADDMGLGKTIQALALLDTLRTQKKLLKSVLIVVPKTLIFNWEEEINKFTTGSKVLRYEGSYRKSLLEKIDSYDFILVSYHILRLDIAVLSEIIFDYVILDEAQVIKNPNSKVSRSVKKLRSNSKLALTGTPIENNLIELWSLFQFLNPGYLFSFEKFKDVFAKPISNGDRDSLKELQIRIAPFMLRRLKSDVELQLPPKTEQVLFCDLEREQKKFYSSVLEHNFLDLKNRIDKFGWEKSRFHVLSLLMKLRQVSCHPKLIDNGYLKESAKFELLKDRVVQIILEGHKVVIFSQFVKMLEILRDWLKAMSIEYELLTGRTKKRKEAVERFNNDPNVSVFLISLKAGGVGINLTAAEYVFIYDPWWNPAVEAQAMDRVYRIGQTKNVFVYKLLTKDTVEEKIFNIQKKKSKLYKDLFIKEDQLISLMDMEELRGLFG